MPEQNLPPDLTFVRQRIERLERELTIWKTAERELVEVATGEPSLGLSGLFRNLAPYDAICAFLKREGRPQPRAVIIKAVIEGGATLGQNKEKSINQSVTTNTGLGKLKEQNGLVGLPDWADEMFVEGAKP